MYSLFHMMKIWIHLSGKLSLEILPTQQSCTFGLP